MPLINTKTNESYEINSFNLDAENKVCSVAYTKITLDGKRLKASNGTYTLENHESQIIDPEFQPAGVPVDPQKQETWGEFVPSQFPYVQDKTKLHFDLIKDYITGDGESGYLAIKNMLYRLLQKLEVFPNSKEWEVE